jgi:hypothetical protein
MKTERYVCDIKDCGNNADIIGDKYQVIFHTDQTEGRSVKPYLSIETIDMCFECYDKVIKGNPIHGHGAQGNNVYSFTIM